VRIIAPPERFVSLLRWMKPGHRAQVLDGMLLRSLRRWSPSILHIIGRETTQSLPSMRKLGVPIVFTELGQLLNLGTDEAEVRRNPLRVSAFSADSTKAAHLLAEIEGADVPFVPGLGGFEEEPPPVRPIAEHFGTLSRLDPVKRVHVVGEAFRLLDGTQRLSIFGDGPERPRIAALAQPPRVTMRGMVPPNDVRSVLDELDALVLASADSEGTPVAVLEAMSRGRPIITTNVGGLSDLVEEGYSGRFFDGSPEDLARAVNDVSRPGEARRLGGGARQAWCQRFSPDRVVDHFLATYRTLV
jgi:glycosyltransferase involved in cell wall biosynthesis